MVWVGLGWFALRVSVVCVGGWLGVGVCVGVCMCLRVCVFV